MKSRISYCNARTLIRKNMTRFAPAWVLYGVFLLLCLVIMMDGDLSRQYLAQSIGHTATVMAFFNACYALLCAQLLFGDLYNSRMCNALHAMPMRREEWFLGNVLSGLIFFLVPTGAVSVLSLFFVGSWVQIPLLWLAATALQFVFFFGVAVLATYCVGNRFAMVAVYGILNGFSLIAYWLVDQLYQPMLYGMEANMDMFLVLCPVVQMCRCPFIDLTVTKDQAFLEMNNWGYLGICAGIGVVCMVLGLLLYRKRNLELAGEFITVRLLQPVFLVLYTLCAGAVCHGFFSVFVGENNMWFLLVGMVIGVFTGCMLLERTVRVFHKRTWIKLGSIVLVFGASLLLTKLDPLGVTRWVPEKADVQSVTVYTGSSRNYLDQNYAITDEATVEKLIALQEYGVNHRNEGFNGYVDTVLHLQYTLKDGRQVKRYYSIDVHTEAGKQLQSILSSPEMVLGMTAAEVAHLDNITSIQGVFEGEITDTAKIRELLAAIVLDCQAGTMAQDWTYHQNGNSQYLSIEFAMERDGRRYYEYRDVTVFNNCTNTRAWLDSHGYKSEK